jgi:REP element-mobilizing transposase RayT
MARRKQLEIRFRSWGGKRKGAGRKPAGKRLGALHRERPAHSRHHPVHATWRMLPHVWNLRARRCFKVLRSAFTAVAERDGAFRIVQFSVQGNHVHALVEAAGRGALIEGLRGLGVRMSRALNGVMGRRGKVLARYDARALKTPREVRHALVYVLQNAKKHALEFGKPLSRDWIDPCSSACWFDGWTPATQGRIRSERGEPTGPQPVNRPGTWLLAAGWRRHGLISCSELPRSELPSGRRHGGKPALPVLVSQA